MTVLWTSDALIKAMGGRSFGNLPESVSGISIDTRTLRRGDAFFAIKGERFDGHDFATAAMAAGASLMVVSEDRLAAFGRLSIGKIVVPDVAQALTDLAHAARQRTRARIIAVTGSAGKTTTKDMLHTALAPLGSVHVADRSFNNHLGVSLTLARLPHDARYAVFEIGMNHAGEIAPLSRMVKPHVAVITMIAGAHLGHFKNLDEIAMAKAEIYAGLVDNGQLVINRDDPRWNLLSKIALEAGFKNIWGFGEHARAQFRLAAWEPDDQGSNISIRIAGQELIGRIGAPGRHMVQNALAVLGAGYLVGADVESMLQSLSGFQPTEGRGRRYRLPVEGGEITLIDESYNANPASMRAALHLLSAAPVTGEGRRIAVLGDMLELGEHAAKLHEALGELALAAGIDALLIAGPEMKALANKAPEGILLEYREDVDALAPVLLQTVRPGDAIMVKSSNGIGFRKLVEALMEYRPVETVDAAHVEINPEFQPEAQADMSGPDEEGQQG